MKIKKGDIVELLSYDTTKYQDTIPSLTVGHRYPVTDVFDDTIEIKIPNDRFRGGFVLLSKSQVLIKSRKLK